MKIDLSKFKCFWSELEDGTKVDELPKDYSGYVSYGSAFPCQFSEELMSYNYHPKKWYEKLLLKINPKLQEKWNITKGRTFKYIATFNSTYKSMSDVIVAMVNSGDYTLEQAIWLCAESCERCMNVLAYKYLNGKDGYAEYSDEWHKCNTVCDFCEEEVTNENTL